MSDNREKSPTAKELLMRLKKKNTANENVDNSKKSTYSDFIAKREKH